jgi:hypothetical protein
MSGLTGHDVAKIKVGMTYREVIEAIGDPGERRGFGREFFLWPVESGKKLEVFMANGVVQGMRIFVD